MSADPKPAWIETAYRTEEALTEWRIVVDGRVVEEGLVADEASEQAFEAAKARAAEHDLAVAGWKHSVDQLAPMFFPVRSRTTTDRSAPLRLHGYAHCADGGREAVGVSPLEIRQLEEGTLPCPVCGDPCGAQFEPNPNAKTAALVWAGSRWHH